VLEAANVALDLLLVPNRLLHMFMGICLGITIGFLPGLGGLVGMALLLPFIYGMDPATALAMAVGMIAVLHTADTFPSVLIGIPGSSGAQATIMDGYPLAQKGQASRALAAAFVSSALGGLIGGVMLLFAIPLLRPILQFMGSPELFMLTLLGLSTVGVLAGSAPIKGLVAGVLGLLIGTIGMAPTAPVARFVFDQQYLLNGVSIAILALGLFGMPELLHLMSRGGSIAEASPIGLGWLRGVRDAIRHWKLIIANSLVGVGLGFIPGVGGSVIDWLTYGMTSRFSKNSAGFGKGDIRGVIAPESANNAKEGGGLIPTLFFGVPGSGITAMLLAALSLIGVQPGPRMATENLHLTLLVVWTLVLANVVGAILCVFLSRPIAGLTRVPGRILAPCLIVLLALASYQTTRDAGDFVVLGVFSLLGVAMLVGQWPRPPLLIGFVLSIPSERYFFLSTQRYGYDWLTRPSVIILGLLVLTIVWFGFVTAIRSSRASESVAETLPDTERGTS
jgi:putative tricarboxylic transport membrane protein